MQNPNLMDEESIEKEENVIIPFVLRHRLAKKTPFPRLNRVEDGHDADRIQKAVEKRERRQARNLRLVRSEDIND